MNENKKWEKQSEHSVRSKWVSGEGSGVGMESKI